MAVQFHGIGNTVYVVGDTGGAAAQLMSLEKERVRLLRQEMKILCEIRDKL